MPKTNLGPGDQAWLVDTTNHIAVESVRILDRHPRPGHTSDIEYTVRYDSSGRVYRFSQYLVFPPEIDAIAGMRERVENRRDRDLAHAAKMQKWLDEHPADEAPVQEHQSTKGVTYET